MFIHYLRNAFRVFSRNSGWLAINLFGLSIGIAASFLILLYIANEISFDRFHENGRNIWRVLQRTDQKESNLISSTMPAAVGISLKEEFPEIINVSRVAWPEEGYINYNGQVHQIPKTTYADSTFFEMFSFPVLDGDKRNMLTEPFSIVFTKNEALKIFGNDNPIGKTVVYRGKQPMKVTGVILDFPENSHVRFDALISFSTLYNDSTRFLDWNGGNQFMTYVSTSGNFNPEVFKEKLSPFLEKHINYLYRPLGVLLSLDFEPLFKIHLNSKADEDVNGHGNIQLLIIFGLLAIFILLISIFNFTNLATAKAMTRAKETGIRKVSGANRRDLVFQYLLESIIMAFLAMILAGVIIEIILPYYSGLVGYEVNIFRRDLWWIFPSALVLVVVTGLLAGAYPSFYLSSFEPVKVLKGGFISGKGKRRLSSVLVVLQFIISIGLLNCTAILIYQMNYIKNYELGFQKNDVLAITLPDENLAGNSQFIENEFGKIPGVISCGAISEIPGGGVTQNGYFPEGMKQPMMIHVMDIDEGAIPVLGLQIIEGRNFEKGTVSDQNGIIVNETFVKQLGWENPLGKKVYRDGELRIIGVVKDFHFSTLHDKITPLILNRTPFGGYNYLVIRIENRNRMEVKGLIESQWRKLFPDQPYIDFFISSYISTNYSKENLFGKIFTWFSAIAIILAFMGLLGLSSYSVQQRRKEIGLRKIYGASTASILQSLTGQYFLLTIIAGFFAIPVSWILMSRWMENFSYQAGISYWIFIGTTLLSLFIALLAVGYQSVKASLTNPAKVIQYE